MKTLLVMAGIVAFLAAPAANATIEVRITNTAGGGDTGWITCAGSSCVFAGAVGNYFVASNVASRVDPSNPFLDMSYSATTSNANPGTIVIEAMADGYIYSTPQFEVQANGNSTLATTANTIAAYGGVNNTICAAGVNGCTPGSATGHTIASTSFPTPPNGYGVTLNGAGNTVTPYSLGISFTSLNPTGPGSLSGDIQLNAVPEPTSILLLSGVVLSSLAGLRRKLRRS
jgi:hypothetical protein